MRDNPLNIENSSLESFALNVVGKDFIDRSTGQILGKVIAASVINNCVEGTIRYHNGQVVTVRLLCSRSE